MTIDTLIVLCAIAGGIWLVRLSVMVGLLVWRRRLRHGDAERPTAAETVSILIPARNEAANIRACLESLLNQDYPHIEIIVADDRSDDGTDRIVEQLAADRPRLRLLRIGELEDGWTGKTHALHLFVSRSMKRIADFVKLKGDKDYFKRHFPETQKEK